MDIGKNIITFSNLELEKIDFDIILKPILWTYPLDITLMVNYLRTKVIQVQPYVHSPSITLITPNKPSLKKMTPSLYILYSLIITFMFYWLLF